MEMKSKKIIPSESGWAVLTVGRREGDAESTKEDVHREPVIAWLMVAELRGVADPYVDVYPIVYDGVGELDDASALQRPDGSLCLQYENWLISEGELLERANKYFKKNPLPPRLSDPR